MEFTEAMEELVRQMNDEIKRHTGDVTYTDDDGKDKPLSYVEHAGGFNIACYIAGQEVPVGYINVEESMNEQNQELDA
jgi:hypothetical protein|tara:strand:- start:2466 stop:2699 length:234 start_codon:yes stop_codon:yes gene_type:complete